MHFTLFSWIDLGFVFNDFSNWICSDDSEPIIERAALEDENKSEEKVTCVASEDRNIFEKIFNYFVGEVCVNPTKSNNETEFTDLVEEIEGLTDSLNNTINCN